MRFDCVYKSYNAISLVVFVCVIIFFSYICCMEIEAQNIKPIEEVLAEQLELHKLKVKEYDKKATYHRGEVDRIGQVLNMLSPSIQQNIKHIPQPTQINMVIPTDEESTDRIKWVKLILGQFRKELKAQYNEEMVSNWFPVATEEQLRNYRAACSGALGRLEKRGKVKSDRTTGTKGYLWGLTSWFEGDTIKNEYK